MCVCVCVQHRRLDAVYYYMRSLFAKSPVQSAHDNLIGLFEESNRKVSVIMQLFQFLSLSVLCMHVCVCVCVKAMKQEEEKERERQKMEREALRRKKREERKKKRTVKEDETRHEIVFPSGHREVWVVPGCEEWRERRRRGRAVTEPTEENEREESEVMTEEMEEPEGEVSGSTNVHSLLCSAVQLVRHLTAAFLMVHGKLYTKIG